jgi:hypothetical protein
MRIEMKNSGATYVFEYQQKEISKAFHNTNVNISFIGDALNQTMVIESAFDIPPIELVSIGIIVGFITAPSKE